MDFSFSLRQKEITQPEGERITVLPLKGATVVLAGDGKAYRNYAALIRTAAERVSAEPKRERTLAEKLRLYLLDEASGEEAAELREKYAGTFDCYVLTLVADSSGKLSELKNFLETMRESGDLIVPYDNRAVAFIKKCGAEDEYRSATDFAFTLYDNIKEELRINFVINVGGTVHSFDDVAVYFQRCFLAYEFGQMLNPNEHIYSYKEYIMIKMLNDIPLESLGKYLDTLLDRDSADILDDPELMLTAEEFLKNSLNISETSRSMFMHRNTLIYRIDKIEKATGLNLRHFNDAVAFRLLTVLSKLVKKKHGASA
ncbi:MAG: helix-turn-helix domain-containing protein [Clostridiales bacterium]|nr:helix-turn-helix domain-containing protein [Clostridiales bacterium]